MRRAIQPESDSLIIEHKLLLSASDWNEGEAAVLGFSYFPVTAKYFKLYSAIEYQKITTL